jgi:hypothetical protein
MGNTCASERERERERENMRKEPYNGSRRLLFGVEALGLLRF